jgi:hypothetical protein
LSYASEISIGGKDLDPMAECVSGDDKIQCFDVRTFASKRITEIAGLFPERGRLLQQMARGKKRQDTFALAKAPQASAELGENRPAQGHLV